MRTGTHLSFQWIESAVFDLGDLPRAVPDLVVGRCVAIGSFDCGPLEPTREELQRGWTYLYDVTYIPDVHEVSELPYDGYDDWYVLDVKRDLGSLDTFVNYTGFGLSDPEQRGGSRDATWDAVAWREYVAAERKRQVSFWAQVDRIQPETCILNGDLLVIATRNLAIFESVLRWQAEAGPN